LNKAGKDVLKLGVALIPIAGQLGIAVKAASVGLQVFNIFKELSDPKAPEPKMANDFMALFQINPEVSALLDDKVEYDFIKYAETEIKKLSDDKPVPDFFKELQKFIQQKYSKEHNITKSMNLQK
jgi:hypothetical protein